MKKTTFFAIGLVLFCPLSIFVTASAANAQEEKSQEFKKQFRRSSEKNTEWDDLTLDLKQKFIATMESLPSKEDYPDFQNFKHFNWNDSRSVEATVICSGKNKGSSLTVVATVCPSEKNASAFLNGRRGTQVLYMVPGSVTGKKIGDECYNSGLFSANPSDDKKPSGYVIIMARKANVAAFIYLTVDDFGIDKETFIKQKDIDFVEDLLSKTLDKLSKNIEALSKKETPTDDKTSVVAEAKAPAAKP